MGAGACSQCFSTSPRTLVAHAVAAATDPACKKWRLEITFSPYSYPKVLGIIVLDAAEQSFSEIESGRFVRMKNEAFASLDSIPGASASESECNLLTMNAGFQCAGCGEWNETTVDTSGGWKQHYIEDCQVCCKPNLLLATYDSATEEFTISAELE